MEDLPMDDDKFLSYLHQQELFCSDFKGELKEQTSRHTRSSLFLDKIIKCSLEKGNVKPLEKLLLVMKNKDHSKTVLIKLASDIEPYLKTS